MASLVLRFISTSTIGTSLTEARHGATPCLAREKRSSPRSLTLLYVAICTANWGCPLGEVLGSQHAPADALFNSVNITDVGDRPAYKHHVGKTVGEVASEQGKDGLAVFLDLAVETELDAEYNIWGLTTTEASEVAEVFNSPYVVPGVSDGGAHHKTRSCGAYGTEILTWLVRDNEAMTLEEAHWHLSYLPAYVAGMTDRGFLREGAAADIIGYDLENLAKLPGPYEYETAYDLPEGDWRRIQRADGYRFIMVNGETTFENGDCTNATPGRPHPVRPLSRLRTSFGSARRCLMAEFDVVIKNGTIVDGTRLPPVPR